MRSDIKRFEEFTEDVLSNVKRVVTSKSMHDFTTYLSKNFEFY
jgi:hypothetical protein